MEPIVVFEEDCTDLVEDYDYGEEEYVEPEFITLPDVNYVPSRVREIVHDGTPPLGFRLVLPPRPYAKPSDIPRNEKKFVYIRRDTEEVRICDVLPIVGYNITDHCLDLSSVYVRRQA